MLYACSRCSRFENIPDDLHRRLKFRAALLGMSMSDYVLREIERLLEKTTREELYTRIARLPPLELDPPPTEILRQEREGR